MSCIGATDDCEPGCYGCKGQFWYPEAQAVLAGNWIWFKTQEAKYRAAKTDDERAEVLGRCAQRLAWGVVPPDADMFRPYGDGDMHSQFAVNVWCEVALIRPEVNFWMYTRSFVLDLWELNMLPNVNLYLSADRANRSEAETLAAKLGCKLAYGPVPCTKPDADGLKKPLEPLAKNVVVCPATDGRLDADGACRKCQLCVVKGRTPKHIAFLKH
jgi:hypothetical protein